MQSPSGRSGYGVLEELRKTEAEMQRLTRRLGKKRLEKWARATPFRS